MATRSTGAGTHGGKANRVVVPDVDAAIARLCAELGMASLSPEDARQQGYRPVEAWLPHLGNSSLDASRKTLGRLFEDGKVERVKVAAGCHRPYWYRPKGL